MSILICNDDGLHAPGLLALRRALADLGTVFMVAPDREQSASSHSLTLHRPLRIRQVGEREWAVDGTPTDCVLLAVRRILPSPPKLIVSGINHGANLADDVTYSGTVSAALEGTLLGIPSIAVSVVGAEAFDFSLAARFVAALGQSVLERGLPRGVYLNVNVPGDLVGFSGKDSAFEMTRLGKRHYGTDIIVEKTDPRGRSYFWIGGEQAGFEAIAGSDCSAVVDHAISVTPLRVDLTHYEFLENLRHWELDGFRRRAS